MLETTDPSTFATSETAALSARNITKEFPGTLALDNVSLDLKPGEIHALLGENGAGKSTLIKCICGAYAPTSGQILVDGKAANITVPADATAAGIAVVHQHLNLIPSLNVAENIALGENLPRRMGLVDWPRVHARAREVLDMVDLDVATTASVSDLRADLLAMISIAKAVSTDAKVIILDEPTNSLLPEEVTRLFERMRTLAKRGHSFLYVSHRLSEVFQIADRATVLRDGRNVGTFEPHEMDRTRVIEAIVGHREDLNRKRVSRARDGSPRVEVIALSSSRLKELSFSVAPGEIVGIAGLPGSGADESLDALFGRVPATAGTIRLNGKDVRMRHPADAIEAGIAFVPKDRLAEAIMHGESIRNNVTLPNLKQFLRDRVLGIINRSTEATAAKDATQRMNVRMTGIGAAIDDLSGGNQQKVVLGRWLMSGASVFLLNSPTAAVDVGAKSEIYELIDGLAKEGASVIFASTELEEYPIICDRVLVLHYGKVVAELSGDKITESNIMTAAAGGHVS
jgi:ABC-type sugar transport system ATPase subunit